MEDYSFATLIELTAEELHDLCLRTHAQEPVSHYARALKAYLRGEIEELKLVLSQVQASPSRSSEKTAVAVMIQLRLEIRTYVDSDKTQKALLKIAECGSKFSGEALWLLALASEVFGRDLLAQQYYLKAFRTLEKLGSPRKALKALLNYTAACSRASKQRRLTADYSFIYKKALRLKAYSVAGIALLNLALEYEKLGAYQAALNWLMRSLVLLQHEEGGRDYVIALSHRSYIQFKLGRLQEAKLDLEEASTYDLVDISGPLKILSSVFAGGEPQLNPIEIQSLPYSWKVRLECLPVVGLAPCKEDSQPLTKMESQLIQALSRRPRTKFELMSTLYGDLIDIPAATNRLNNLLNRFRKKCPGVLIFEDGRYRLSKSNSLISKVV